MAKPQVLRLGTWDSSVEAWARVGEYAEVIVCESKTRDEFLKDLKGKYSKITSIARTYGSWTSTGRFDAEVAAHMPDTVRSISHCGAGYDQIDVAEFTKRNIQVSNITTPVEAPTAVTAVYLTLAAMRNFQEGHNLLVQGLWPQGKCATARLGMDPEGKVLGILGMGGIGRAIRDRLQPFGFEKIVYYNRSRLSADLEKGAEYLQFDEFIATADVIMVSVPLNAKTHHLLNKETLYKMKKGVVLINTARGAVIDEAALTAALKDGHVGAFGADVFEFEPEVSPELYNMPNVVSLPHMGTQSVQAMVNLESFVVMNVEHFLKTGKVKTVVPEQQGIDFGHQPVV